MTTPNTTGDAYGRQLKQLLARGRLWMLGLDSWLSKILRSLAEELGRIDARSVDFLIEAFPPTSDEMLADWERVFGLPDGCLPLDATLEARQATVAGRLIARGGASPAYFVGLAAALGFVAVVVETGPSTWRMDVDLTASTAAFTPETTFFCAGSARAGDSLGTTTISHLECAINRTKPAHTIVTFVYS
jgi:uncharacterized protein YmfQ (DUF2313 family)